MQVSARWKEAVTAYGEAVRLVPDYAGALYNLGFAYLRLGQKSSTLEVIAKVKPLNWDLQARLWQEILAIGRAANPVAVAEPTPTAAPPAQTSSEAESPTSKSADEECPQPTL